mmetsp:Transcript_40627/g.115021  ORF Transcript_40627/g.115021 Transcript_40627/m.115021 type:complete len:227 (+) Transcript_40627:1261-1941(+)
MSFASAASLARRRAEPADFMDFPVASFADCRPPAFALTTYLWKVLCTTASSEAGASCCAPARAFPSRHWKIAPAKWPPEARATIHLFMPTASLTRSIACTWLPESAAPRSALPGSSSRQRHTAKRVPSLQLKTTLGPTTADLWASVALSASSASLSVSEPEILSTSSPPSARSCSNSGSERGRLPPTLRFRLQRCQSLLKCSRCSSGSSNPGLSVPTPHARQVAPA